LEHGLSGIQKHRPIFLYEFPWQEPYLYRGDKYPSPDAKTATIAAPPELSADFCDLGINPQCKPTIVIPKAESSLANLQANFSTITWFIILVQLLPTTANRFS